MSQTFAIVFVPHALALAGSLFLHFDFLSVFFLTQASLYSALANAVTPLIKDRMEQQSLETPSEAQLAPPAPAF